MELLDRRRRLQELLGADGYREMVELYRPSVEHELRRGNHASGLQAAMALIERLEKTSGIFDPAMFSAFLVVGGLEMGAAPR